MIETQWAWTIGAFVVVYLFVICIHYINRRLMTDDLEVTQWEARARRAWAEKEDNDDDAV